MSLHPAVSKTRHFKPGLPLNKQKWVLPLALFTLVQIAVWIGIFTRSEMALYDTWFRFKGVQDPGEQIVIAAMDEPSIRKLGPLPWPRSLHAQLLDQLQEARTVGFDLLFDAPSNPENDAAFTTAVKKHGKVILASQFTFEQDENGNIEQTLELPTDPFMEGVADIGFVNFPTDIDRVVRRTTLVDVNTFNIPFPSFSLAVMMAAHGDNPTDIQLSPGQLHIAQKTIPLDAGNRALPNFWGPKGTFDTISYADIIEGKIPPSYFKDKIVLVGSTTAADRDTFSTPYTTSNMVLSGALPTPGVEIHAAALQSFFTGSWHRQVPSFFNILFLLITGLTASFTAAGRGPWSGLFVTLALAFASAAAAYGLWHAGWWLNLAAPLVLIFLTYAAITARDFIRAEIARRRTKAMFSRYLSPDVVETLVQNGKDVSLGGNRQFVTLMFCDIRGFTAYSENKTPEEVVSRLNEYLTVLTHVIFKYGGTLDKYLGDGLMAIFGAPVHHPDHIERAIKAATEIQNAVEKLNIKWEQAGEPPLKVGVGINTGSVLVGNVGSPERMDYTAIGEDVNLASRMESATKVFETLIIISERSVHQLPDDCEIKQCLRYLGTTEVKGFSQPIGTYTIIG